MRRRGNRWCLTVICPFWWAALKTGRAQRGLLTKTQQYLKQDHGRAPPAIRRATMGAGQIGHRSLAQYSGGIGVVSSANARAKRCQHRRHGILSSTLMQAGRAAVELFFVVLLPVMIVMLAAMRLLEAYRCWIGWCRRARPAVACPFGLPGLGVFAALQINLVSFAAPVATLSHWMERRRTSARHLAATLAMVMAMAQANAAFPLAARGLQLGPTLLGSLLARLAGRSHPPTIGFARHLSLDAPAAAQTPPPRGEADSAKGVLRCDQSRWRQGVQIALGALPMLVLSLVAVIALTRLGAG